MDDAVVDKEEEAAFKSTMWDSRRRSRAVVYFLLLMYGVTFHVVFEGHGLFWLTHCPTIPASMGMRMGSVPVATLLQS